MSEPTQDGPSSSNGGQFGQPGLLNPSAQPQQSSSSSGPSIAQLRGSRASMSAPSKDRPFNPHATNPGRIPTAGGVAVGSRQFEARRASRISTDMGVSKSPPQSPPPVAEQAGTGAVNGSATAREEKPMFSTPDYGNGGVGEAGSGGGKEEQGEEKGVVEKATETVKENAPAVGGGPSSPSKERRASRFDMFKEKLGMSGKK